MAVYDNFPYTDFHELNLDWVITTVKNCVDLSGKTAEEMADLKSYVTNYFDNLDIQEEVNNKLEDMADSGELVNIIAQYLQMASIIAYDTKASLKASADLTENMTVITIGKTSWDDGYTALYKIKPVGSYVVDDDKILALANYPALVAVKVNEIEPDLDTMVVFGDSWTAPDVTDAVWSTNVASYLRCSLANYAVNGAFLTTSLSTYNVNAQINAAAADSSVNPNKVKYAVILGGINDYRNGTVDEDALSTTISTLLNRLKSLYPNALLFYISNCQYPYNKTQAVFWSNVHRRLTTKINVSSLNTLGLFGHTLFNSTMFHLTNAGQRYMASQIIKQMTGGSPSAFSDTITLKDTTDTITAIVSATLKDNLLIYSLRIRQIPSGYTSVVFDFSQLSFPMPWTDIDNSLVGGIARNFTPYLIQRTPTQITVALQSQFSVNTGFQHTFTEDIYG